MTIWHLFVDESGDFGDLNRPVCVAGVALRLGCLLARPDQLNNALAKVAPGVPWPVHTSVLNRPAAVAMAPFALRLRALAECRLRAPKLLCEAIGAIRKGGPLDHDLAHRLQSRLASVARSPLAAAIEDVLRANIEDFERLAEAREPYSECPPSLWAGEAVFSDLAPPIGPAARQIIVAQPALAQAVVVQMAKGEEPSWEALSLLEKALENPVSLHREVISRGAAFSHVLRNLDLRHESGLPGALLFVAAESRNGDFCPPGDGKDRYVSLLEALLTRVVQVVSRFPGPSKVEVRIASRFVAHPNEARMVPMAPALLASLTDRAQAHGSAALVLKDCPRYRDTSDPGFMLADFAANRARWALRRPRALCALESDLKRCVGLTPRSGEPPRTHVVAAGSAWAIRASGDEAPDGLWPFAVEQAREWGAG